MAKLNLPEPRVIWDIGSRDGRDAQSISEAFPKSRILAFEPNPETFPLLSQVALVNSKINPRNTAVSTRNGLIDFYNINTNKTITSRKDGNPGASSLLESSGNYPIEKYVQDLIQVRSIRASDLIKDQPDVQPNLLWVDVQGSEDQVFVGFEQYLNQVDLIVVELSLKEIYKNQPLAQEVLSLVKDHFFFVKVLNMGLWQFDAMLINKNAPHRLKHWFLNKVLLASLSTSRKFGISRKIPNVSEIIKLRLNSMLYLVVNKTTRLIAKSDIKFPDFLIGEFLERTKSESHALAHYSRQIAETLLPTNPLNTSLSIPEISVVIPVISKDLSNLNLIIEKIIENSVNPVRSVTVVYSGDKPKMPNLQNVELRILSETDFIPVTFQEKIGRYPKNRQGWVRQQVIKFLGVSYADVNGTLVCDSDTFLLEKRLWLNEIGEQQLQVSHEYSLEYEEHFLEAFGGLRDESKKISFVTHHQLMQKDVVHSMFGKDMLGLLNWLEKGNADSMSPISEYHSYGRFISANYPARVKLSKWNNLSSHSGDIDAERIIALYTGDYSSFSSHRN